MSIKNKSVAILLCSTFFINVFFIESSLAFSKKPTDLTLFMTLEESYGKDDGLKSLAKAAGKGQIKKLEKLVAQGQDVNAKGKGNTTALFWALKKSNLKGYRWLLEHGADPNVMFDDGGSVMYWAVLQKKSDHFLRLALRYGGDPNLKKQNYTKEPLIFTTLVDGFEDRFDILIDAGADINVKSYVAVAGVPLIVNAIDLRQTEIAYKLLELGADYKIRSDLGYDVAASVASAYKNCNKAHESYQWLLKIEKWLKQRGVELPEVDKNGRLIYNPWLEEFNKKHNTFE